MIARILITSLAVTALGVSTLAHAALGDTVESVQADKATMRAKAQVSRGAGDYTVHEIQLPSGTVVREYASSDGKIFAIAWEGPSLPDIKQLLGKYFQRYASAMEGRRPAQRHAVVRQQDLVVQSHGRMGAFSGHAYLPQALPQGVSPEALQ